jgi:hypothetical protein
MFSTGEEYLMDEFAATSSYGYCSQCQWEWFRLSWGNTSDNDVATQCRDREFLHVRVPGLPRMIDAERQREGAKVPQREHRLSLL